MLKKIVLKISYMNIYILVKNNLPKKKKKKLICQKNLEIENLANMEGTMYFFCDDGSNG